MTRLFARTRLFAAAVFAFGACVPPAADAQSFSQTTIPVNGAFSLVAMKTPTDNHTPLVAGGPGGVTVLTNNGSGTFSPSLSIPGAAAPSLPALAIGDVNGDGYDDIVTLAVIPWGQAGGSYVQQNITPPSGANAVAVGDVNGDLIDDIAFS